MLLFTLPKFYGPLSETMDYIDYIIRSLHCGNKKKKKKSGISQRTGYIKGFSMHTFVDLNLLLGACNKRLSSSEMDLTNRV